MRWRVIAALNDAYAILVSKYAEAIANYRDHERDYAQLRLSGQMSVLKSPKPERKAWDFSILDFRFQILDFKFQISDFRFLILDFKFQISDFKFQISDFRFA